MLIIFFCLKFLDEIDGNYVLDISIFFKKESAATSSSQDH